MDRSKEAFETLFNEKITLYRELIKIAREEKESLKTTDVDALWRFSEQKQNIASKIEGLRRQILEILNQYHPGHGMNETSFIPSKVISFTPFKNDGNLKKICMTLTILKDEMDGLVRGNKAFVEEYLAVLDEMINIIVSAGKKDAPYENPYCRKEKKNANLLLHREV